MGFPLGLGAASSPSPELEALRGSRKPPQPGGSCRGREASSEHPWEQEAAPSLLTCARQLPGCTLERTEPGAAAPDAGASREAGPWTPLRLVLGCCAREEKGNKGAAPRGWGLQAGGLDQPRAREGSDAGGAATVVASSSKMGALAALRNPWGHLSEAETP